MFTELEPEILENIEKIPNFILYSEFKLYPDGTIVTATSRPANEIIAILEAWLRDETEPAAESEPGPEIDWSKIDQKYKWVAIDYDGSVFAYGEPYAAAWSWCQPVKRIAESILSADYRALPWRETLRQRPEGK